MIEVKNPARLTLAEIDSATLSQLFVFCRRNQAPYVFLSDSLKDARAGARRLHRALFSQEWVPVGQELPPDGELVIITCGVKGSCVGQRSVGQAEYWRKSPAHMGEPGWYATDSWDSPAEDVLAWRFEPEPYAG